MNAMTETEVCALNATTTLETADLTKNLILVALSRLVSREPARNVRKKPDDMSIPPLAASIDRVGLLQNLIVTAAADGEHYDVVAGGRRLAALRLLAKKRRIPKEWEVPCLLVADGAARTASLTENVQRQAMHPADQFEAFAALVAEGRSIEDIAADFSVTPLVVQRRLKLANVSPRLLADYRADALTLDQLMALAITDEHAAQEAAFYDAPAWQRSPAALRERLTEREIEAWRNPLVQFVGLDAYQAAGGGIRRDLFAEGDAGVYLADAALLEKLAQEKLSGAAAQAKSEGWAWVDVAPAITCADLNAFQRAPRERRDPDAKEAERIETLKTRMRELGEAVDAAMEAEDQEKANALEKEGENLGEQLQALEDGLSQYSPAVKTVAGAIVTVDHGGQAMIHRGLLREAQAKALRALGQAREGAGRSGHEGSSAKPPKAAISDKLAQRLSVHRTAALQIEVARHPQAALAALVHEMVETVLYKTSYGLGMPLGVKLDVKDKLQDLALDWPDSPAAVALRQAQEAWAAKLPRGGDRLFPALLAMKQGELVKLLAVCLASTVNVVTPRAAPHQPGEELARAVELDMAAWWKPTSEGYFQHVSKAVVLQAVAQFAPQHVNRLGQLKKSILASEAERLVEGTGWMPAIFKAEKAPRTEQETGTQQDAQEDAQEDDATGEADETAEALAA